MNLNNNDLEDEFLNSKTYKTINETSKKIFSQGGRIGRDVGRMARDFENGFNSQFNQNNRSPHPYDNSPPPVNFYGRDDGSRATSQWTPNGNNNNNKPPKKNKKPKRKYIGRGLQIFLCIATPIAILGLEPLNSDLDFILAGGAIFAIKYFFDFINFLYYKDKKVAEPQIKKEEFKQEQKSTGNSELDKIIKEGNEYITQLKFADDVILNEEISDCIRRMEKSTKDIFDFVKDNPKRIPQIKKFMNYYLPTTLKLLTSYQKLNNQSVKGDNIKSTMVEIERIMETIAFAFEKQLDSLFSQEAINIQTDISVFESILEQEGLKDEGEETINLKL